MQGDCNKDFYTLIFEISKLEDKYEELREHYKHLKNLWYKFWKDNRTKMNGVEYEYNIKKHQIEELTKQISQLQLDDTMKKYYDLYTEKSKLVKEYWSYQLEIGYIGSDLIFDCICDEEEDRKLANKRKEWRKKRTAAYNQIVNINSQMASIYPSIVYDNPKIIENV